MTSTQPLLDTDLGRYVVVEDGKTAALTFELAGDRLVIEHVVVPDEINRRGIGGVLVATAVGRANHEGLTVVPSCPFARSWLRRHPEIAEVTSIDWVGGSPR